MTKVVYTGPQPARTIVLPEGRTVLAEKGKQADVPYEVAKELVKQESWAKYGKASKSSGKRKTPAKPSGEATPATDQAAGTSTNPED